MSAISYRELKGQCGLRLLFSIQSSDHDATTIAKYSPQSMVGMSNESVNHIPPYSRLVCTSSELYFNALFNTNLH